MKKLISPEMNRLSTRLVETAVICLLLCPILWAQERNRLEKHLAIAWENDTFSGSDGGYTNGIIISYSTPWKPISPRRDGRWIYSIGQLMMTPDNIERSDLIENDRPYAGVLFGRVNRTWRFDSWAQDFGILFGIVGPSSQADDVQEEVHEMQGINEPQGWEHQLKDEPVLNLDYEYRHGFEMLTLDSGRCIDWTIYSGAAVGNLFTAAKGGTVLRIGRNLPGESANSLYRGGQSGVPNIESNGPDTSLYMLFGVEGHYVFHSIFLDGNTWKDSHSVDRIPAQGAVFCGVGFIWGRFSLSMHMLRGTNMFEGQGDPTRFGTMTISYSF